jgi:MFS-type transporter involved in bile tolerance (Atg22 family)
VTTIDTSQARPQSSTNGLAIAGFVLGIVWLFWLGSALAIIFGHISLRQIKRTGESGRGFAIAALALGYVGAATLVLTIILSVVSAGQASRQIEDVNRQINSYSDCLDQTPVEQWDICDRYLEN